MRFPQLTGDGLFVRMNETTASLLRKKILLKKRLLINSGRVAGAFVG